MKIACVAFVAGLAVAATARAIPPEKAKAEAEWQAVQACQFAIKATVNDPASLEFPGGVTRSYRKLSKDGIYTVQVRIRARNAFNAMRTSTVECKVGPGGRLLGMREIP